MIPELLIASKRLVESVEFDVNGTQGAGGHGGLTSDKTLRAAGELRILIDRAEHAAIESERSASGTNFMMLVSRYGEAPTQEAFDQIYRRYLADCERATSKSKGGE